MPNANRSQTVYVSTSNPDSVNDASLYAGGELGQAYDYNDRAYQIVKLDSGAGVSLALAANQLLYWKDRSAYLVTNDYRFGLYKGVANSHANNVAGILRNAATAGRYIHQLIRGRNIAVKEEGSATAGMRLVASVSSPEADTIGVAVGTTLVYNYIGNVRTATSTVTCYADVDMTNTP